MLITFDEKAGRYRFTRSGTIDGKRVRETKLLPKAWDEAQAYKYAEHEMSGVLPWLDSLRKQALTTDRDTGTVYVIRNEYMRAVKIGVTRNTVHERIRNLGTAHLGKWLIIDHALFNHAALVECALHRHFGERRTAQNREFFSISDQMASDALQACYSIDGAPLAPAISGIGSKWQKIPHTYPQGNT